MARPKGSGDRYARWPDCSLIGNDEDQRRALAGAPLQRALSRRCCERLCDKRIAKARVDGAQPQGTRRTAHGRPQVSSESRRDAHADPNRSTRLLTEMAGPILRIGCSAGEQAQKRAERATFEDPGGSPTRWHRNSILPNSSSARLKDNARHTQRSLLSWKI
jgi:hypothetical protein